MTCLRRTRVTLRHGVRLSGVAGQTVGHKEETMSPPTFEVRVAGVVPEEDLRDLQVVTHSTEGPSTVLYGEIRDEAALFGLLTRLRDLGIAVIEVRRNPIQRPNSDEPAAGGSESL
jgi:hypothetical protein